MISVMLLSVANLEFFQSLTRITWLLSTPHYSTQYSRCQPRQGSFSTNNRVSENKLPGLKVGCELRRFHLLSQNISV